ncbi:hypothetical protein F-S17_0175 [Faustovirus]|nr:hypothetical protein F-LCD7_0190 [Faustovirus]QJX71953.1 hypothetical protein F-M6_0190 [Faustovirus]QJX72441.1 hypothetical protein F-S17_0175 [Faustovirus]QJX72950.1 hypothetical protein F-VV57_0188 [Faustovirus]QJX73455.1 hypothetical protein F-VV63_0189 [Faustovirus]
MDGLDGFIERGDGVSGGFETKYIRILAVVLIILIIFVAFYMTRTEAMENSRWNIAKQYLNTEKIRTQLRNRVDSVFA